MMDWRDKMRLGVELIHEACEDDGKDCRGCPLDKICDVIVEAYEANVSKFSTPDTWNI